MSLVASKEVCIVVDMGELTTKSGPKRRSNPCSPPVNPRGWANCSPEAITPVLAACAPTSLRQGSRPSLRVVSECQVENC
mmetsp:Transcript_84093/g.148681  ORF Transcript_84093/g.148681 Transcript_84093/m.148681 type:complete len:80 (-) Transcript_84093:182-421(-)